ncbi:MAG: Ig-like domain-containing protein [Paludibacteraceae bacterium]|nr:Ig-like domain-containing protein [Paludibacteraceae bacterium]
MKTVKLTALMLAALAIVACEPKNDPKPEPEPTPTTELTITPKTAELEVGQSVVLTANVASVFSVAQEGVVTLNPADDSLSVEVTAVAVGNAIITATAGEQTAKAAISVKAPSLKVDYTEVWPIILDDTQFTEWKDIIKGDFRPDDETKFLYVWAAGETYAAGDGLGSNYYGHEGYTSLTVVAPADWSGCGFCMVDSTAAAPMKDLVAAINAEPDKYFLHLGMKATTQGNHQFYIFNDAATSFAIGTKTIEAGEVFGDFTRDGSWAGFDIPMTMFTTYLSTYEPAAGHNILCALSGNSRGSQLNMDAVFFYKKK